MTGTELRESSRQPTRNSLSMFEEFVHSEVSGAVLLFVATLLALLWANSAWHASYSWFWKLPLGLDFRGHWAGLDLRHWIDDGLMAVFFFVVGLEIKREFVKGELASLRQAALPILAAAGGMIVPAGIYLLFNSTPRTSHGWGIPMATDIAFALGVLALLGKRIPPALRVFLLALAIADDVGAILVIAVFYTEKISLIALSAAVVLAAVLALLAWRVNSAALYLAVGVLLWVAVLKSGVHATIAGVGLGLLAPLRPTTANDSGSNDSGSMAERFERAFHPWVSFLVLPLFALANAGVALNAGQLRAAFADPVAAGIFLGLVIGKPAGVISFSFLAVRCRIAALAEGLTWRGLAGAGLLAGIGFTVALFISGLAFASDALMDAAKVAILAASVVAGALGCAFLRFALPRAPGQSSR